MTDTTIGARIRSMRRERGFRTTRDLADAMPGSRLTEAILENIESGRKADLNVSQLLSIALALRVPPIYLLAPVKLPTARVDLPNVSDELRSMTSAEFDSWFAGIPSSAYSSSSAKERIDVDQLNALRTLQTLRRELTRLDAIRQIEAEEPDIGNASAGPRSDLLVAEIHSLEDYLNESGWNLRETEPEGPARTGVDQGPRV